MTAEDFKDYYQTLNVSPDASAEEIKKTYYQLARKYHPDLNPGDIAAENYLKKVNEAHSVLSDAEKRQEYDLERENWQKEQEQNIIASEQNLDSKSINFGKFFHNTLNRIGLTQGYKTTEDQTFFYDGIKDIFGRKKILNPEDREGYISLTLDEAFNGKQEQLQIDNQIVEVNIPAGAKTGSCLKLKGKGNFDAVSRKSGDYYLNIELQPHNLFEFERDNLFIQIPITPHESVLGVTIEVPTIDGQTMLDIPPRVNSGQCFTLAQQGWLLPNQHRSDLIVKLKIVTPDYMSEQEEEYYLKIQEISNFNPRHGLEN